MDSFASHFVAHLRNAGLSLCICDLWVINKSQGVTALAPFYSSCLCAPETGGNLHFYFTEPPTLYAAVQ